MAGPHPDAPGPDVTIVSRMLGPLVPLHTLCALLLALRLYTRARGVSHLSWDDAAVALAMLASTVQFALVLSAVPFGAGRHNFYIPLDDQVQASRLLFLSRLPWAWGVALGKISIALLLLRFNTGLGWRVFLYMMMVVQIAWALSANILQLLRCRPISAAWRIDTEAAQCLPAQTMYISIYVNGAVAGVSDVVLALVPLTFLRSIRRSPRERAVIAFLMGLGLFAAAAVFYKLTLARTYGQTGDMLWDCVALVTWSLIEAQLGIVAACLPCLKSPLETVLRRIGLMRETPSQYRISYTDGCSNIGGPVDENKGKCEESD